MTPRLTLEEWDLRYEELVRAGMREPEYGGPLRRHVSTGGDFRLLRLRFDGSEAALRLWNLLLTENERLDLARKRGDKIVGTMKDLGTVPVMAYSLPKVRAFYPDGAWWTPCIMECTDDLLQQSEKLGIDASFCPVRAMLAAFVNGEHFPRPDLLICSTGAVCDDFSAIAQRLERLGFPIEWWEIPRRREAENPAKAAQQRRPTEQNASRPLEPFCKLPGIFTAPKCQVEAVREELERIGQILGDCAGCQLDSEMLSAGIKKANEVRRVLEELRSEAYEHGTLPSLEMLIAEMLAIHFCSDREEALVVLGGLLAESNARLKRGELAVAPDAVRVYWVNPVADLRIMNFLEDWGGRVCGSDYMFSHALDLIPEDLPPFEALARTALADPMVGSAMDRAKRIILECRKARAEAVVVSRIPGASHCASEGGIIREMVRQELNIPTIELEIPPICDAMLPTLSSRVQALLETARSQRKI